MVIVSVSLIPLFIYLFIYFFLPNQGQGGIRYCCLHRVSLDVCNQQCAKGKVTRRA